MVFFYNIIIFAWSFAIWYFSGLGPSLLLLPQGYRSQVFLLAPLIGMSLLTLVGMFEISVLLIPFSPWLNIFVFILITSIVCLKTYRIEFFIVWKKFRKNLIWALWPVLPLIIIFAWLFHNSALHLLVGSSDQLQYCENARQILEEMHKGSTLDVPIARQEYFVYEVNTHFLPYLKYLRRGAEILLASTKATSGLSYYQAFPVTICSAFLTLLLSLNFLGRSFHLSRNYCLLLQLAFFCSFYFFLLHVQGSLAMLTGMAPGLMTLALLAKILKKFSWRWLFLTAIVFAAYLSIYSEPALINIVLPLAVFLVWQLIHSRKRFFTALRSISTLYTLVFLLAPFAIYSVIVNAVINITDVNSTSQHLSLLSENVLKMWDVAAVILGIISYYDISHINGLLRHAVTVKPIIALVAFVVFYISALLGYLKSRQLLARLMLIPLTLWILVSCITVQGQDYLRFVRSLHYIMPFAIIGVVLLSAKTQNRWYLNKQLLSMKVISTLAMSILIFFIGINGYTDLRTIHFITSHETKNDPILLRFEEQEASWQQLKDELKVSALHHAPVLISGFQETIRPLAISIILRDQPHVLGESILSFWHLYSLSPLYNNSSRETNGFWPFSYEDFSMFNTRFSADELRKIKQRESRPWDILEADLVKNSEQAVIPIDQSYPIEWLNSKDKYIFRSKKLPNICQIIYRQKV